MTRCYWAACAAQVKIRFSVFGAEKRPPGGGKTRGSGNEKRCSHKWFHRIFPCTDPRTEERYLRCSKRFDHRSHSIIFLLFEFKSVDDVGAGKLREMLTLHTNSHAVHGRFTLKKKTVSVRFGTPGPPRELK